MSKNQNEINVDLTELTQRPGHREALDQQLSLGIMQSSKRPKKPDVAFVKAAEAARTKENQDLFVKCIDLFPQILDRVKITEFLRISRLLINRFQANKALFRSKGHPVFNTQSLPKIQDNVADSINRLNSS